MKKLLSLLSVLTISGTAVPTTIAASSYEKLESSNKVISYKKDNLKNLNRSKRHFSGYDFHWFVDRALYCFYKSKGKLGSYPVNKSILEKIKKNWQKEIYNNKTGLLKENNKEKLSLENSTVWGNTFTNSSNQEQVFSTQSYEKSVTKTTTWNVNMSITEGVEFDFFIGKGNVQFTISGGYSKAETETEILRLASQIFKVNPNSVASAQIILEKGTYKSTGTVKFEVDMSKQLDVVNFFDIETNENIHEYITVRSIINDIINSGEESTINSNDEDRIFKVLTVDNVNNPTKAYFNIPITWNWTGNNLIVNFSN